MDSEKWALNAGAIREILQKGPPFPDDPWVQFWVGADGMLEYYGLCMLHVRPPQLGRARTSWEFNHRVYKSHLVLGLVDVYGEAYTHKWCVDNRRIYYEKPIIPKNMNRGKLPF